jgi:hypothetical protein
MTSGQEGNHDEGNQSGKASNWKDRACWWSEVSIPPEQLSRIYTGSNQKCCKRKDPHDYQQRADGLSWSVDSERVTQHSAQERQDAGDDKKHERQLQCLTTCVRLPGTISNHRHVPPPRLGSHVRPAPPIVFGDEHRKLAVPTLRATNRHICSLVQALHRHFDVSRYSTYKIPLIRGAYSPFTHRNLVSRALRRSSDVHGSRDSHPQRYRAARLAALPSTPYSPVAITRGRTVLREDRSS